MIFLEYLPTFQKVLCWEKQQELLKKIKRDVEFSEEKLAEQRHDDKRGGEIVDIKLAEDGSVRTYVKDRKQPIRGYADSLSVQMTTTYKHLFVSILRNLSSQNIFGKAITLLFLLLNRKTIQAYTERMFGMFAVLLKEENWSAPVKEIRRVLKGKLHPAEVDGISMIIEYDSAYQNRARDVLPELDKTKLRGLSAIKEVSRIFDILIARDYEEMRVKWRGLQKMMKLAMLIPSVRRIIILILKEIDLDIIKFQDEELYWINMFPSYNYRGMELRDRLDDNIKKYGVEI